MQFINAQRVTNCLCRWSDHVAGAQLTQQVRLFTVWGLGCPKGWAKSKKMNCGWWPGPGPSFHQCFNLDRFATWEQGNAETGEGRVRLVFWNATSLVGDVLVTIPGAEGIWPKPFWLSSESRWQDRVPGNLLLRVSKLLGFKILNTQTCKSLEHYFQILYNKKTGIVKEKPIFGISKLG